MGDQAHNPLTLDSFREEMPGAIPNDSDEGYVRKVAFPPQPNMKFIIAPEPHGTHFMFYRRRPFRWWQVWLFKWATGIVIDQRECENQWRIKKAFTDWAAH